MRIFFAEEIIGQARIIIKLNGFNANAFERLCSFDNELHRRGLLNHRKWKFLATKFWVEEKTTKFSENDEV